MSPRVYITTFRQWLVEANGKATIIDAAGDPILEMLQKFDPDKCADVWAELGEIPELAILAKNAVFNDEIAIVHYARSFGNEIYGDKRRQYAIVGLEDTPLAIAIDARRIKSTNVATKVPSNDNLLACKTEVDLENLARPTRSRGSGDNVEVVIPNIMVIPPN